VTMPSEEWYRAFIAALRANTRVFEAAKDDDQRRNAGLAVLEGVASYLLEDPEVRDELLLKPLSFIIGHVSDSGQGRIVTALAPTEKASGRPTGLVREVVQGTIAFAIELLVMAARVPASDAAAFVVAKARKLDIVTESGDALTADQVADWRHALNRGAGTLRGREVLREYRNNSSFTTLFKNPSAEKRKVCERIVEKLLAGTAATASQFAPNRRRA
jgi:hypothetical protein